MSMMVLSSGFCIYECLICIIFFLIWEYLLRGNREITNGTVSFKGLLNACPLVKYQDFSCLNLCFTLGHKFFGAMIWLMHSYGKILLLIWEVLYRFAVDLYEYGFIWFVTIGSCAYMSSNHMIRMAFFPFCFCSIRMFYWGVFSPIIWVGNNLRWSWLTFYWNCVLWIWFWFEVEYLQMEIILYALY